MIFSDDIKATLNAMNEGILIIDNEGLIIFGNSSYLQFVSRENGLHISDIIGRKLQDIRPGAQLPQVVRSGVPLLRQRRQEKEDIYFVNMYPIRSDGKVIGGLSVVTFMDDANAFRHEIDLMERRNIQIISKVGRAQANATFNTIVAKGRKSVACTAYAKKISDTEFPVLITSENGVGKSIYAQAIHNAGSRAEHTFLKADCLMLGKKIGQELFGTISDVSGKNDSIGFLEAAKGGTLFIDEISEMPMDVQVKLYETIQSKTFSREGGDYLIPLEARIIAASSVSLEEKVAENRFSPELFYLLNTFCVHIPPLRERMDDLPLIVKQELARISTKQKRQIDITDAALERLMNYRWPGNIKELQNVLEFSAYLAQNDMITEESLPENIGISSAEKETLLSERVRTFEKNEIMKMLEFYGNDLAGKKTAAQKLGISLASLYSKIK